MEFLVVVALLILGIFATRKLAPTLPIPGTDAYAFRQTFGYSPVRTTEFGPAEKRFVQTVISSRRNDLHLLELDYQQAQRTLDQSETVSVMIKNRRALSRAIATYQKGEKAVGSAVDLAVSFAGEAILDGLEIDWKPSEKALSRYASLAGIA